MLTLCDTGITDQVIEKTIELLEGHSDKWRLIGEHLGFTRTQLEDPNLQLKKLLSDWRTQDGKSHVALVNAIRKAKLNDVSLAIDHLPIN